MIEVALILSVIFQFGAFVIALSLLRETKFSIAWLSISIGFLLMIIRRVIELVDMNNVVNNQLFILNYWIAVFISILMFIASIYVKRILRFQFRIIKLKKDNEAKVLSAIITTEEKDRYMFAKELHDGLGPILSAIKMSVSAINVSDLEQTNEELIRKTESAVDVAIQTVKEISNNLSPHILERNGLEKAVRYFIQSLNVKKECDIEIVSNIHELHFDYNTEVVVYRIVCELLNNTFKYAGAKKINISLHSHGDMFELLYSDDGVGFENYGDDNKGMGISNIKSRVKSLGGRIEIFSKSNQGFFIIIKLPLKS